MKLSLKVIYDTESNWKIVDNDDGSEMEYGDTPGFNGYPVATVNIDLYLPEPRQADVTVEIPDEALKKSQTTATVTID